MLQSKIVWQKRKKFFPKVYSWKNHWVQQALSAAENNETEQGNNLIEKNQRLEKKPALIQLSVR